MNEALDGHGFSFLCTEPTKHSIQRKFAQVEWTDMICREFPGPINRRWKEKGANILRTNLVPRVLSYPSLRRRRDNG